MTIPVEDLLYDHPVLHAEVIDLSEYPQNRISYPLSFRTFVNCKFFRAIGTMEFYFNHSTFINCEFYDIKNLHIKEAYKPIFINGRFEYCRVTGCMEDPLFNQVRFSSNCDFRALKIENSVKPAFQDCFFDSNVQFNQNIIQRNSTLFPGDIFWKKAFVVYNPSLERDWVIIKMQIPKNAEVISFGRKKCRTNKAKVLGFYDLKLKKIPDNIIKEVHSQFLYEFKYRIGETIEIETWDSSLEICSFGIHGFANVQDAIHYDFH